MEKEFLAVKFETLSQVVDELNLQKKTIMRYNRRSSKITKGGQRKKKKKGLYPKNAKQCRGNPNDKLTVVKRLRERYSIDKPEYPILLTLIPNRSKI